MGNSDDMARMIEEHAFFAGVHGSLRTALLDHAALEIYGPGQLIFREGERADHFYLIRQGQVAVEVHCPNRPSLIIQTLQDHDVLGWSWLSEPHRWSFDARAVTQTRLIALDAASLRARMEADPALGYEVLRRFVPVMADRLHAARLQMLDLYGPRSGGGLL